MPTDSTTLLSTRLEVLHNDVGEIKDALKSLSEAITKLALVEERQSETAKALERCFSTVSRLEERVTRIELKLVNSDRTSGWVDKAVLAAVVIAATFVAKKVGLA